MLYSLNCDSGFMSEQADNKVEEKRYMIFGSENLD